MADRIIQSGNCDGTWIQTSEDGVGKEELILLFNPKDW